MTTERMEVQRTIEAEPAAIFAVLSDPQGHVAIDSSGMLMDATGEPVSAVGDTFVVHMDREALNDYPMGKYDVTVKIIDVRAGPRDRVDDRRPDQAARSATSTATRSSRPTAARSSPPTTTGRTSTRTWKEANIFPIIPETALRATLGILARTVLRNQRDASN